MLHTFCHPVLTVATCCKMLDGVRSGLKMVKFLSQHFWMLQDIARVCQMLADVRWNVACVLLGLKISLFLKNLSWTHEEYDTKGGVRRIHFVTWPSSISSKNASKILIFAYFKSAGVNNQSEEELRKSWSNSKTKKSPLYKVNLGVSVKLTN